MRKIWISTLILMFGIVPFTPALADSTFKISFVLINPLTGQNAGSGNQIMLFAVNRDIHLNAITDSNGVVSFETKSEQYILRSYCPICFQNHGNIAGTQYLIRPSSNGGVEVLSAADEVMGKDSNGNWIISAIQNSQNGNSGPWQPFTHQPNLSGNQHIQLMFMLTNGKVFAQSTNGQGVDRWWIYSPDNKGNYANGSWSEAANPIDYNPVTFNGAVLHSGNVLVVGGEQNYSDAGIESDNTNKSELYNPVTNTWTEIAPPDAGKGDWANIGSPPFVELPDGRVMLGFFGQNGQSTHNESVIFDEKSLSWTTVGTNKTGRNTEAGFTLLPNDKILTVDTSGNMALTTAEIYDPGTGLWAAAGSTPASLEYSEIGPALTLPNGNVIATGATGQNALYNPKSNSWSQVPAWPKLNNGLQLVAQDNAAAILPNGNVLTVTAGFPHDTQNVSSMGPAKFVEYDSSSNSWNWVPNDLFQVPSSEEPNGIFMLPLPTGQVMVANNGQMELYNGSNTPDPSWLPVIGNLSSNELTPSGTYTISGNQLSGLTQGQQWGDEWEAATNYPLVQIENIESHRIYYGRTFDISNTSITPGAPSTFSFNLDSTVENGPSTLRVIASGFASPPVAVTISGGTALPSQAKTTPSPTPSPTPSASASPSPTAIQSQKVSQSQNSKATISSVYCVKGPKIKKVTGLNPKCPTGYKIQKKT